MSNDSSPSSSYCPRYSFTEDDRFIPVSGLPMKEKNVKIQNKYKILNKNTKMQAPQLSVTVVSIPFNIVNNSCFDFDM